MPFFVRRVGQFLMTLALLASFSLTASAATPREEELSGVNAFKITSAQFAAASDNTTAIGNSAGSGMIKAVGNTVSSLAAIIVGPVLYIIMGLAIMISVFGFVSGKMVMAFSGIGAFILAGVLKALFGMVFKA